MKVVRYIRYGFFAIHLLSGVLGIVNRNYELLLLCISLLCISNMIYALEEWKERFLFFLFHCTLCMFLMARPIISVFKGYSWKIFSEEAMNFTFMSLWLTMMMMVLGAVLYEKYTKTHAENQVRKKEVKKKKYDKEEFRSFLQITSIMMYIVSTGAYLYLQMEKLFFMQGRIYYEFYTDFASKAPYIVHLLASFRIYSLAFFLATKPKKKSAVAVLFAFIVSDFPVLLYGKRSLIMIDALFIFIYYVLRDGMGEKWIGKFEKICIAVGGIAAVIGMGAMNYIRDGIEVTLSVKDLILDFLYKQGVSFNVLNIGYESIPFLPERAFRNYTFGGIIDYVTHGSFAQRFFGAESLGEGNNLHWALESNSFAHNMSYVATDNYLEGHGLGSSYLLEVYADYGYLGTIIFSLILGAAMIWFVHELREMNFKSALILIMLINFFFMPRGEATGSINFLVYLQFWAAAIACYAGAAILEYLWKRYKLKRKNGNTAAA